MRKKNKKSVFQTAPPPWRNLIYINILHNCDVRFRSRRQAEQPHARLPTVAQRVITRISTTNLQKIFRQPGGLLQAVATHVRMAPVCIIPPQKLREVSETLDGKIEADTGQVEWPNTEFETLQRPLQAGMFRARCKPATFLRHEVQKAVKARCSADDILTKWQGQEETRTTKRSVRKAPTVKGLKTFRARTVGLYVYNVRDSHHTYMYVHVHCTCMGIHVRTCLLWVPDGPNGARLQYAGSKKYVTNSALTFRRLEGGHLKNCN